MKTVMSSLDSLASASSCAVTFAARRWLISPLMITVRARNSRSATRFWTGTSIGSSGGRGSSSIRTPGLRPTLWRKLRPPTRRLNPLEPLARRGQGRVGGGEAQLEPLDLRVADRIAHAPLARAELRCAGLHLDEDDPLDVPVVQPVEDDEVHGGAEEPGVLGIVGEAGQVRDELLEHFAGGDRETPLQCFPPHGAGVSRFPYEE